MSLFELFGTIAVKNSEANAAIDETTGKAGALAKTLDEKFTSAGKTMTDIGKAITPLSIAAGGLFIGSVKSASDFDNSVAKVSTLVDTSKHSVDELSKTFLDLSNSTGRSATELAEAGYQALSASVDYDHLGSFVETATNLSKVGFTDSATAVDVLTTAINAYGMESSDANDLANKLVKTQNLGKTTVAELAQNMGRVIPVASSMGVSIDDLCAGYVSLTKQGINTRIATTDLQAMFEEFGDSGSNVSGILREKTGMSFKELMEDGRSLSYCLSQLKDYADETGTNFNELWSSSSAGTSAMALLNGGLDELNQTAQQMSNNTDALAEGLDKLNTPSEKARKSFEHLRNSGIQMGDAFLVSISPAIDFFAGLIEKLTQGFDALPAPIKTVIATVLGIIGALGPVLMLGGKILEGIGTVISHIAPLVESIGGLQGVLEVLAGPIGIAIAVVTLLAGAFKHLWDTNEGFRTRILEIWDEISGKVTEFVAGVQERLAPLEPYVEALIGALQAIWDGFCNFLAPIFIGALEIISGVFSATLDIIMGVLDVFVGLFTGNWQQMADGVGGIVIGFLNIIVALFSGAWDAIKGAVDVFLGWFGSSWDSALNAINSFISDFCRVADQMIQDALNSIKNTFTNIWNTIKTTVTNVVDGVKSAISNGLNSASSTVTSVLDSILSKFRSIFDTCKSVVTGAIDTIKGAFNFSWSLPHLKLPHPRISGSFSLNPPSVPSFSLDWYAKAMDTPYMFTDPTIFGMSPTGNMRAAGEAGDEIMYGHQNLLDDIDTVVGSRNGEIVGALTFYLGQIVGLLNKYLPELGKIYLDKNKLVGGTVRQMNEELGNLYRLEART